MGHTNLVTIVRRCSTLINVQQLRDWSKVTTSGYVIIAAVRFVSMQSQSNAWLTLLRSVLLTLGLSHVVTYHPDPSRYQTNPCWVKTRRSGSIL